MKITFSEWKDFDFILQEKEILGINFNFIKLKKILAKIIQQWCVVTF